MSSFGAAFHANQLIAPEALEDSCPLMHGLNRTGIGAIKHLTSISPCVHQIYAPKHLEMFRNRGLAKAQRRNTPVRTARPVRAAAPVALVDGPDESQFSRY